MGDQAVLGNALATLLGGRGYVDVSARRTVRVAGPEARAWLHDLLTADIEGLRPGGSRRSLLLTPTGRIRADVQVLRRVEDVLLVQDPGQPDPIDTLLAPYLLSASVTLEDATGRFAVFALPDAGIAPAALQSCRPSCLGPGCDIVSPRTAAGSTAAELVEAGFAEVGGEAAEAWRIVRGVARMGAEFDQRSLPAEAGLEHLIDTTKGCFLGQESVARIRNLGHPPRVLRHVRGVHELPTDARVLVDGASIGTLTSATSTGDGWIGFAQVVWAAATARLTDIDGHPLVDLGAAG